MLLAVLVLGTAVAYRRHQGSRQGDASKSLRDLSPRRRTLSQRETEHEARGRRRQRLWLSMRGPGLHALPGRLDEPMRALQKLHGMLAEAPAWEARLPGSDVLEITERADRLYDVALGEAERALHLDELARTVESGGQVDLRQRLDEVLTDLSATVRTLAAALDQLHASAVGGGFDPSIRQRLRDDMDARLQVATRVEQRMAELE